MKHQFALTRLARAAGVFAVTFGAAFAASAAAPTTPSTVLYGGGATLPGIAYVGAANAHPDGAGTASRLSLVTGSETDASTPLSLLYNYINYYNTVESANQTPTPMPSISYCQTGSGAGKKVFDGGSGANFSATVTCPTFSASTGTTIGFGAPTGGTNQYGIDPAFTASDAPLSASEYNFTVTNKGNEAGNPRGQAVQFPVIAGAVAIIYNNPDVDGKTAKLSLTDADICNIFSGNVTDWSSSKLSFNTSLHLPSRAIKPVYRSDGSGTTFAFSNHLAAVCKTLSGGTVTGHFQVSQTFSGESANPAVANLSGSVVQKLTPDPTIPGNFLFANGNPAIISTVGGCTSGSGSSCTRNGTVGSISYAEAANTVDAGPIEGVTIKYAKVNGFDPITSFPAIYTQGILLPPDQVITGNNTDGTASVDTIVDQSGTVVQPNCVYLADPGSYSNPTGQYPIMAISYLIAYNEGYGADANNMRRLVSAMFTPGVQAGVTGVGSGTGFGFLSLTDSGGTAVDPVALGLQMANCINK